MRSPLVPNLALTDGTVVLRASDLRDIAAIDVGINDPDVIRWLGPPEGSAVDVLALNQQRWASGSPTLSICEGDGPCVGLVWLNVRETEPTTASVGYWLLPGARGRGLATRAVQILSACAAGDLGVTNLRLLTELANKRSQRVAERSGFRRTGVRHGQETIDGRLIDQVVYELALRAG